MPPTHEIHDTDYEATYGAGAPSANETAAPIGVRRLASETGTTIGRHQDRPIVSRVTDFRPGGPRMHGWVGQRQGDAYIEAASMHPAVINDDPTARGGVSDSRSRRQPSSTPMGMLSWRTAST